VRNAAATALCIASLVTGCGGATASLAAPSEGILLRVRPVVGASYRWTTAGELSCDDPSLDHSSSLIEDLRVESIDPNSGDVTITRQSQRRERRGADEEWLGSPITARLVIDSRGFDRALASGDRAAGFVAHGLPEAPVVVGSTWRYLPTRHEHDEYTVREIQGSNDDRIVVVERISFAASDEAGPSRWTGWTTRLQIPVADPLLWELHSESRSGSCVYTVDHRSSSAASSSSLSSQ
jgi:hypothetical protein